MACYWTTRCCSAFALIACLSSQAIAQAPAPKPTVRKPGAQKPTDSAPLGLFPPDLAWDLSLNSVLEAPPAFSGDRAYFPIADNRIAAYDIRHGTLLWIAPGTPRFEPIVAEDLLFEIDAEAIIALHTDTGVEAWRFELAEPLSAPLSWGNGWLVATTSAGTVFAFRASDGGLIWRRELDAVIHARATVAQNRVYVPMNDGRIIALQVENGEPVWERRLGGAPNEIAATPERVYAGSNDNFFYALRARDGLIEWRWSTGADVIGRPVVDAQRVYFVSFDNVLRALDKNIGNQRWKRPLSIRPTRGPVVMGDMLIVSGVSASALVFTMKDGTPVGSLAGPTSSELAAAPHVVTGEGLPMVMLVLRDLTKGTILRTVTRSIEPQVLPLAPLPNPTPPPAAPPPLPDAQSQPADTDRATEDAVRP